MSKSVTTEGLQAAFEQSNTMIKDYVDLATGNVISPVTYNGDEISMLSKGLCIGDSLTVGIFDYNSGESGSITDDTLSYPKVLQRLTGNEMLTAARSGFTFKGWFDYVNGNTSFAGTGFRFAIIFLGICDAATYSGWLDESAENLTNIVNKLREDIAGIKLFIVTLPQYFKGTSFDSVSDGIRTKSEELGLYLIDLRKNWSECNADDWQNYGFEQGGHFHSWGQYQLAKAIKSYISYIIKNNPDDFKDIQFVGTDYSWTE